MPPLNVNTSIVDFLKSRGEDPSFEARKKRYESLGLNETLGDFRGSAVQNSQLLKVLSATPKASEEASAVQVPPLTASRIVDEAGAAAAVPPQFNNIVPPKPELSPEDILARVREKPGVQFAEKEAALKRQALEGALPGNIEQAQQKAAASGVLSSGRFGEAPVGALTAEQVAKELNIDMDLAKIITKGIEDEVADTRKAEEKKAKEEADFLKSQGLVRDPSTGEVVPSIAEKRAAEREERAEASSERAAAAAERAERSLALSEARYLRDEERRELALNDDVQSIFDGIIGIADVPAERRGTVIQKVRESLLRPVADVTDLSNKLTIASEMNLLIPLSEDEIRLQIYDGFSKGDNLDSTLKGIANAPISNKELANKMAQELYSAQETTESSTTGGVVPDVKIPSTSGSNSLQGIGTVDFSQINIPSLFRF